MDQIPIPNSDHPLVNDRRRVETIWYQTWRKVLSRINKKPKVLATATTTSGTTHTMTGFAEVEEIVIEVNGVSFTAAGAALTLALSDDGGSTFGSPITISGVTGAGSDTITGVVRIANTGETGINKPVGGQQSTAGVAGVIVGIEASKTGPTNALRFAGGTFDAGTIRIYGVS